MKITRLFSYVTLGFAVWTMSSCAPCDCDKASASAVNTKKEEQPVSHTTRGENSASLAMLMSEKYENVDRFALEGGVPEDIEVIGKLTNIDKGNEDIAFIKSIFNTLRGAENTAQQLDIKFSMSEEPVENGMFIFSIESQEEKELTFQMYDEEGFDIVAYNQLAVNNGKNYRALNVNAFEDGTYIFKLSDESGKELVRRVEVAKAN